MRVAVRFRFATRAAGAASIALALLLLSACHGDARSVTTTTTPGRVVAHAPLLVPVLAHSHAPCLTGTLSGFGPKLNRQCFKLGDAIATTSDVSSYSVYCSGSAGWQIDVNLHPGAAEAKLKQWSASHIGADLAIEEDGVVVLAPRMNAPILGGAILIDTNLDEATARRIGARTGGRQPHAFPGIVIGPSSGSLTIPGPGSSSTPGSVKVIIPAPGSPTVTTFELPACKEP
jgi:hypothetical protein